MEREVGADAPYPYAKPKTFQFLKAAIAEGAHLETPKYIGDKGWAKTRNIAGIYFSTELTFEEIGEMYGYTGKYKRAGPRYQVNKFLDLIWENSTPLLRALVPRWELSSRKPSTSGAGKEIWKELELLDPVKIREIMNKIRRRDF